jgi:hypothetical protein
VTLDILRRTGGWCVELQQPLKGNSGDIPAIEIRPTTADQIIRWAQGQIPSTLALLSELCGVPERTLRQLPNQDFERVMLAMTYLMPAIVKADWEKGDRPLATPNEELVQQEDYVPPPDPVDPRFPLVDGPVRRMPPNPPANAKGPVASSVPEPEGDAALMNMAAPPVITPVH